MGTLELSAAQYRRLLLTRFVIPDNAPPASMRQWRCWWNHINNVATQKLFRLVTYSLGLMHSSISLSASIIKRKVKSELVQPCVIRCRLEKQPRSSASTVIYQVNSSFFLFFFFWQATTKKHTCNLKTYMATLIIKRCCLLSFISSSLFGSGVQWLAVCLFSLSSFHLKTCVFCSWALQKAFLFKLSNVLYLIFV